MVTTRTFEGFSVGDCAVFRQSFTLEEFEGFAALSGDRNPLHHDAAHAATTDFGQPIVPMHMTIAPLSRIAGMIFPGVPSLYLGHELRSIMPVHYGDDLAYSARITAINPALRTLTIRVLVSREGDVVLDAEMRVMSQDQSWRIAEEQPDLSPPRPYALITGATGEIGTALAAALIRRGWNLLLVDRGPGGKRDALAAVLAPLKTSEDQRIEHVAADLTQSAEVDALCDQPLLRENVTAIFHTASPPLDASIGDLVQVNYSALQRIATSALPAMLLRQQGVVATIGSIATERVIPGWHDYSAAKAMAGQFLTAFDKTNSTYGVRGLTVLSGLVMTAYSASAQGSAPALLPEELAEQVLIAALDDKAGQAVVVEWNGRRDGQLGFHADRGTTVPALTATHGAPVDAEPSPVLPAGGEDHQSAIMAVVRRKLNLPVGADLAGGGVGLTPGWDSLRHIELVLELESAFGIRFKSGDVDKMLTFEALNSTTLAYIAQR